MERNVEIDKISDGKRYGANDLVKVGCDDCRGCSACCNGMGDSIVLDPMDVYRLEKKLGKTMEEILLAGNVALRVVDGVILPHLKMTEQSDQCSFLNEEGRCSIHDARDVGHLIIFDIYENNAYQIQKSLEWEFPDLNLTVLIGSVRDERRLESIFSKYRPDIVFHAAAHKHVPLMEDSPNEAIKNNVIGTLKTARTASHYQVKKFILISTDKAVNPTNIMGASKRLCEMVIQLIGRHSTTEFAAVRFGNVLGSNGSVIPLFRRQIEHGGPVTVTHPDIIRYFMTIPEAVSLVLEAGAYAKNGQIFVLNMGDPVRIADLAKNMIRLSGYEPEKEIKIKYIGLRPGEKLYEELLMNEEGMQTTENSRIFIGRQIAFDEKVFREQIKELAKEAENECPDICYLVKKMVPEYQYEGEKQG